MGKLLRKELYQFGNWIEPWKEQKNSCKYCGGLLPDNDEYCTNYCKEKDSVWHSNS